VTSKKHSRKVSVTRRTDSHTAAQAVEHKVVAVRLKNNGSAASSPPTEEPEKPITSLPKLSKKNTAGMSPTTEKPDVPVVAATPNPPVVAEIADTAPNVPVKSTLGAQPLPQKKNVPESKPETETAAAVPLPDKTKPFAPDKPTYEVSPAPPATRSDCSEDAPVTPAKPVTADIDIPSIAVLPSDHIIAATENIPSDKWYIPQKWKDISLLRKLIMIASVALALFSLLPLAVGVLSPGIVPPVMIAAFFFFCALSGIRLRCLRKLFLF